MRIFKELAEEDVNDSIFQEISIKALIEQKWNKFSKLIFWMILFPYSILLILFTIYVICDWEIEKMDITIYVFQCCLLTVSAYFILIEIF